MGLDISVYKVLKVDDNRQIGRLLEREGFYLISENPELNVFKDLIQEVELEVVDYDKAFSDLNLKEDDYEQIYDVYGKDFKIGFEHRITGEKLVIVNPSRKKVQEKVVFVEEVGYQRKGANNKFYEDGMWSSPLITSAETLLEHAKKYFYCSAPESKGGFGSGVEFELGDEDRKTNFRENIIKNFVEGETFVAYH